MDVLEQLHTEVADAFHAAESAFATLKDKYRQLAAHLGGEIPTLEHQAEADGEQLAAAAAGAVESAVTQTLTSAPPTSSANPAGAADVTTPPAPSA